MTTVAHKPDRLREVVYDARELAETLRNWYRELGQGKVEEVRRAIYDAINKVETEKKD